MDSRLLLRSLAAATLLSLALGACGSDDLTDADTPDAGTKVDAGTRLDAGPPPDAGPVDAGPDETDAGTEPTGPELVVTSRCAQEPRRGPIELSFRFVDADGDVGTGHVMEFLDDGTWRAAAVTPIEETTTGAAYVWDSFADVDQDRRVDLRIVVKDPDGDVTLPFAMEIRNHPDADRLVVVAHAMKELPGGSGMSDLGTEVSVLLWDGLGGGVIGQPRRLDVGQGPRKVRPAPHGRAFAVTEERAGTVSILTADLSPDPAKVLRAHTLTLPAGWPADARWSHDGRHLFIMGSKGDNSNAPAIWKYTPSEDLSSFEEVSAVALLPGPPSRFDVAPNGDFIASCGSGGAGLGKVVRYNANGRELGRVEADYGPTNAFSLTPDGRFALWTSDLFGNEVRQFSLTGAGLSLVGAVTTSVRTPDSIVFHPGSNATQAFALVSNADGNGVTPIVVSATGLDVKPMVRGLPLATDMDIYLRGSQAGTVFVSTLMKMSRVSFTTAPAATVKPVAWDFGTKVTDYVYGIGIQR